MLWFLDDFRKYNYNVTQPNYMNSMFAPYVQEIGYNQVTCVMILDTHDTFLYQSYVQPVTVGLAKKTIDCN